MDKKQMSEIISNLEERVSVLERTVAVASPEKTMLTMEEAAIFLGLSVNTVRALTGKRQIPFYKPNGKLIFFDRGELYEWQKKRHFNPVERKMTSGRK